MDIEHIRRKVLSKQFSIYRHAFTEAFKDGLSIEDILYTILNGEIIEEYPERTRCLIYAKLPSERPVHTVVDYGQEEVHIVTAYIPDPRKWINFRIRRLGGKR